MIGGTYKWGSCDCDIVLIRLVSRPFLVIVDNIADFLPTGKYMHT